MPILGYGMRHEERIEAELARRERSDVAGASLSLAALLSRVLMFALPTIGRKTFSTAPNIRS
jgi:hypothetical protein